MALWKQATCADAAEGWASFEMHNDIQTDCCMSLEEGIARIRTLTLEDTAEEKSRQHHSTGDESGIASFSGACSAEPEPVKIVQCNSRLKDAAEHEHGEDSDTSLLSYRGGRLASQTDVVSERGSDSRTCPAPDVQGGSSEVGRDQRDWPFEGWAQICQTFPDEDGDTVLHLAVLHTVTHLAHLIRLLGLQGQVNCRNRLHQTPLHLAVLTCNPQALPPLLHLGASLSAQDCHGNTALHAACARRDVAALRTLLEGPDDVTEGETGSFLQEGPRVKRGREWKVEVEVALATRNWEGLTCLHVAVTQCCLPSVTLLLRHGADVNARDAKSGRTALHFAVDTPRPDAAILACLLRHPQLCINTINFARQTALQLARGRHHLHLVDLLRVQGAEWTDSCSSDSFSEDDVEEEACVPYDDIRVGGQLISLAS